MDKIYIDDNLIQIDLKTNKKEEVIKSLAQKMLEKNIVKNSYLDAVLKREEDYPTALKTNNINFAIPHTDPEHVKKPALAVALLNNEVNFTSMENYEEEIGVKLVFLMAITEPKKQVKTLKKLIELMQNPKITNKILAVKSKEQLAEILQENL